MDFLNENLFIYTNSFLNKYDISISMLAACFNLVCSQFEKNVSLIERITLPTDLPARLLAFISEHYTEKISLSDVSLRLGYEYHYLSRCFNSCFGMSFRKCLNRYRLNHAKELLVSTEAEISEIALESGFQSIRSFNDEFVNDMGKSPRAFREEMRRK